MSASAQSQLAVAADEQRKKLEVWSQRLPCCPRHSFIRLHVQAFESERVVLQSSLVPRLVRVLWPSPTAGFGDIGTGRTQRFAPAGTTRAN